MSHIERLRTRCEALYCKRTGAVWMVRGELRGENLRLGPYCRKHAEAKAEELEKRERREERALADFPGR